jgi:glycolate oxidase
MALSGVNLKKLKDIVGNEGILTEEIDLKSYSFDASPGRWKGVPDIVVFPTTTGQISQIMKLATEQKIPVTPRGSGSNLSGGSLPIKGGIVLCTTRMNKILNIDKSNFTTTVEVGVVLNDLNKELAKQGLFFPPDPQSFLAATIGGCVSENAGGPYGVKYGVFRQYLLGMTVVLPKGDIVKLGGTTVKNVTGYDLPQLICGSEGTLAIITSVTLHLLPMPAARQTAVAVFDRVVEAGKAVHHVIESGIVPAKIELLDNWVIHRIEEMSPIGLPLDAEAVLLFEMDGMQAAVDKETEGVIDICKKDGAREARAAANAAEVTNIWNARRAGFSAVFSLAPTVFAEDITVPPSRIPELIEKVRAMEKKHDLTIVILGHAGDGNLHPSILTDMNKPEHYARALKALDEIFEEAIAMGGAISGEHGIGLEKKKYLKDAMPAEAIALLRGIKNVFDPAGILNPGKIWEEA